MGIGAVADEQGDAAGRVGARLAKTDQRDDRRREKHSRQTHCAAPLRTDVNAT